MKRAWWPLVAIMVGLVAPLRATTPLCEGCGCQPCTKKVCRLVCEMKEIRRTVYSCKREDFCVPGRSIRCETPCDCPGKCCRNHVAYKPTCECIRTRVVPVINVETRQVPTYHCVVEEVCARCGRCVPGVSYPPAENPADAVAMTSGLGLPLVGEPAVIAALAASQKTGSSGPSAARLSFLDRVFARD